MSTKKTHGIGEISLLLAFFVLQSLALQVHAGGATNLINTTSGGHSVDALLVNFKKYFEPARVCGCRRTP